LEARATGPIRAIEAAGETDTSPGKKKSARKHGGAGSKSSGSLDENNTLEEERENKEEKLLHSGPMLGNLPALVSPNKVDKNSPTKFSSESIDGAGTLSGKVFRKKLKKYTP
jgi:hypothetical protein